MFGWTDNNNLNFVGVSSLVFYTVTLQDRTTTTPKNFSCKKLVYGVVSRLLPRCNLHWPSCILINKWRESKLDQTQHFFNCLFCVFCCTFNLALEWHHHSKRATTLAFQLPTTSQHGTIFSALTLKLVQTVYGCFIGESRCWQSFSYQFSPRGPR